MSQQRIPIYIPTYINNATYQPARVLPRLLFYNGNLQCERYFIQEAVPGYGGISEQQFEFPYFDNYNVVSGSFPTTDSRSLLFNNELAVYGELPTENLYTTYWEKYIDFLYDPITRVLNCKAIIPLADYFKMSLNDIVNFKGNYWHLRAINNYSLKSGDCDLQLLGPIIADVFSDVQPEPTPIPTGSTAYSTASINLNELNSGSVFIDANLIVSGSPYYFSGNFTQYVSGGAVGNVVMEGKDGGSTAWGRYTTASATLTIRDNGTLITSSTQYIYSGSTDTVITFPTTFTAGHNINISGSTTGQMQEKRLNSGITKKTVHKSLPVHKHAPQQKNKRTRASTSKVTPTYTKHLQVFAVVGFVTPPHLGLHGSKSRRYGSFIRLPLPCLRPRGNAML
jgi:hypothetical protein